MHTQLCKWFAQQSAVCFLPPNCSLYLSTVCNTLHTLLHVIGYIRFYRYLLFSPFLVHMEEACTLSAGAPPPCLQATSIELFIDAQNPYFQDIQCLLSMYFSMCPVVSSFYYVGNPRSETQANVMSPATSHCARSGYFILGQGNSTWCCLKMQIFEKTYNIFIFW